MSGMCVAITLLSAGITDVCIYEKADDVGGTWRDNTYPGLTCDVPSRLYQYSFAKNPNWTQMFSRGGEIQDYLRGIAERYGLRHRIRFGATVVSARFDDGRWVLRTDSGTESTVDFLISATGVLHHPRIPPIAGLDDFRGTVFHSARWDHTVPLLGRRIAVIGTGSTGVQLVCGLAGVAGKVTMFQRTAQWVLPWPNPRYSKLARVFHRAFPCLGSLAYKAYSLSFETFAVALSNPGLHRKLVGAVCRASLRRVRDPRLRRALTPDYEPMCKRLVMSGGFYRAIQRDDVELVTAGIDHVEHRGIVTDDGVLHEVDVIVLATVFAGGFDLDGAQAVGANDEDFEGYQTLGRFAELVDKAFVVVENNRGRAGYRLLYSVRQYALEKLSESGEADAVLARYRKHLKQPNQVVRAGSGGVRY